jgi:hypothetical protein
MNHIVSLLFHLLLTAGREKCTTVEFCVTLRRALVGSVSIEISGPRIKYTLNEDQMGVELINVSKYDLVL